MARRWSAAEVEQRERGLLFRFARRLDKANTFSGAVSYEEASRKFDALLSRVGQAAIIWSRAEQKKRALRKEPAR